MKLYDPGEPFPAEYLGGPQQHAAHFIGGGENFRGFDRPAQQGIEAAGDAGNELLLAGPGIGTIDNHLAGIQQPDDGMQHFRRIICAAQQGSLILGKIRQGALSDAAEQGILIFIGDFRKAAIFRKCPEG